MSLDDPLVHFVVPILVSQNKKMTNDDYKMKLAQSVCCSLGCCCCSHIDSHNQVRGQRTGSSHSGVEEHPSEKILQTKSGRARTVYVIAEASHTFAKKNKKAVCLCGQSERFDVHY